MLRQRTKSFRSDDSRRMVVGTCRASWRKSAPGPRLRDNSRKATRSSPWLIRRAMAPMPIVSRRLNLSRSITCVPRPGPWGRLQHGDHCSISVSSDRDNAFSFTAGPAASAISLCNLQSGKAPSLWQRRRRGTRNCCVSLVPMKPLVTQLKNSKMSPTTSTSFSKQLAARRRNARGWCSTKAEL